MLIDIIRQYFNATAINYTTQEKSLRRCNLAMAKYKLCKMGITEAQSQIEKEEISTARKILEGKGSIIIAERDGAKPEGQEIISAY